MTDMTMTSSRSLGVGQIIGETFSIFFKRIGQIALLVFLPALVIVLAQYALDPSVTAGSFGTSEEAAIGAVVGSVLLSMIGMTLITALVVHLAYDAKIGKPFRPGAYLSSALAVLVPLVICTIIVSFATGFAAVALIVPGLYLYAMWSVVTPAIVIERAGFGSFGRSAELTKGYRWSCLGAIIVIGVCAYIPLIAVNVLFGFGVGSGMSILFILLNSLTTALYMAMLGIGVALIYARLREIKEGTSVEQLAEIFA